MTKKRFLSTILCLSMALSPTSAYASEFSDGVEVTDVGNVNAVPMEEIESESESGPISADSEVDSAEFATPEEEVDLFSDSDEQAELFADESVEETGSAEMLAAQDMYNVSVTGEFVRSVVPEFVELLNRERAAIGEPPVYLDSEMMEVAETRAAQGSVFYEHCLPDGHFVTANRPGGSECAMTAFDSDINDILKRFKNSAGHWQTLVGRESVRFGMGIYHQNGFYYVYTNQDPILPERPFVPYTGGFSDGLKTTKMNILINRVDFKDDKVSSDSFELLLGSSIEVKPHYKVHAYSNNTYYEYGTGYFDSDCGEWESLDPEVATISPDGTLTGVSNGITTIRWYVNGDRSNYYQAKVTVKVNLTPHQEGQKWYLGSIPIYGWVTDEKGYKYYTNSSDGKMVYGWQNIDGKSYYFIGGNDNFELVTPYDYPLPGAMLTNVYIGINGEWYNFDSNGVATKAEEPVEVGDIRELKATQTATDSVYLEWTKVSGADGYEILRSDNLVKTVKGTSTTSATITGGFEIGRDYSFEVRPYKKMSGGNIVYGGSGYRYVGIKNMGTANTKPGGNSAPAVPSVTVKASGNTVSLTYKKASDVSGCQMYIYNSSTKKYQLMKTVTGKTVSYKKTGLAYGKTYKFRIRCYKTVDGKKIYSGYRTLSIKTAPAKTAISKVTSAKKKLTVTWKKVSGAEGYQIYRATSKNGKYTKVKTVNSKTTSFANTGLTAGKTYYYKVRAYRKNGSVAVYGAFSAVKAGKSK